MINSDAVRREISVDSHTALLKSLKSKDLEQGVEVGEGEVKHSNCDKHKIDQKESNSTAEGYEGRHYSPSTLPLPLSPPPDTSSTPFVLAVLRAHVHLDFHDVKHFHLITVEEILKIYGIEFSI